MEISVCRDCRVRVEEKEPFSRFNFFKGKNYIIREGEDLTFELSNQAGKVKRLWLRNETYSTHCPLRSRKNARMAYSLTENLNVVCRTFENQSWQIYKSEDEIEKIFLRFYSHDICGCPVFLSFVDERTEGNITTRIMLTFEKSHCDR